MLTWACAFRVSPAKMARAKAAAPKAHSSAVKTARVVLGHVAPVPWKAAEAERVLAGKTITEATATEAGQAALRGARPLSQNAYKVQLARVALKRALLRAIQGGA